MVLGVRVGRRRQVARMARCGRRSGIGGESVRMVGGGGRLSVGMEMDGGVELRCRVLTAWRMSQRCLSVGLEVRSGLKTRGRMRVCFTRDGFAVRDGIIRILLFPTVRFLWY